MNMMHLSNKTCGRFVFRTVRCEFFSGDVTPTFRIGDFDRKNLRFSPYWTHCLGGTPSGATCRGAADKTFALMVDGWWMRMMCAWFFFETRYFCVSNYGHFLGLYVEFQGCDEKDGRKDLDLELMGDIMAMSKQLQTLWALRKSFFRQTSRFCTPIQGLRIAKVSYCKLFVWSGLALQTSTSCKQLCVQWNLFVHASSDQGYSYCWRNFFWVAAIWSCQLQHKSRFPHPFKERQIADVPSSWALVAGGQPSHQPPCPFSRELLCGWYFWCQSKHYICGFLWKSPG